MHTMKTLVLGASGATGKQVVTQLTELGHTVKAMVRPSSIIPEDWKTNQHITLIKEHISALTPQQLAVHITDCDAVVSCLGHNLSWKGIYGKPRKLVTNAVVISCEAIRLNNTPTPTKFILMNTAGNSNRNLKESISFGQKLVVGLLRLLLPPHSDNEKAADYLRTKVGQDNSHVEWVAVRPDNLTHENTVTAYELHASPIRSALFNAGQTSRINVGHFMANLVVDQELWHEWKGQMPVIYNTVTTP